MSQSTRLFAAYISLVSIGSTAYTLVCKNIEISIETETGEAVALKDLWSYPVGLRMKWTATGTFFISTAATTGEGGPGATLITKAISNTQQAFALTDNAVAGAGNAMTGNCLITSCKETIGGAPTDPITIDVTLTGQGALTSTIS